VQQLVNRWGETHAPSTTRRTYDVLRAVFSYAVAADMLPRTPCRGIHLPEIVPTPRQVVTPDEIERIAEAMPEQYRMMVWLGAVLGLRWGEVAGLRVKRLDLFGRTLTVAEQIARGKGGRLVLSPPKSKAGVRTLAIPNALAMMASHHMSSVGLTAADGDSFVFVNESGGPLDYTNFRRRIWHPALSRAGLPGVGFHDLRRAAATALVTELVDIKTAQARLGHSDPRLTLAIYAQATTEADHLAADRLGAKFLTRDRRQDQERERLASGL